MIILKERNQPKIRFKGKCGKYDYELSVAFESFPSSKERDKAYRVWAETFADGFKKKKA